MKNIKFIFMMAVAALAVSSCFKEPQEMGFLGENIYLQGGDTLYVAIGAGRSTEKAWTDNSTKPVTFKIENVRNAETGERHEGFFQTFPTTMWVTPYDFLTDTTAQLVTDKLSEVDMYPLMINEVNGQLRAMPSTNLIDVNPGEVYHVDVRVTNPKGTKLLEDYAIIKFESGSASEASRDFICQELINGIAVLGQDDYVFFPYYEQVNDTKSNFSDLQDKIYAGEEVYGMSLKKTAETPEVGIVLYIKFLDANGNLYDPAGYASYTTNQSFLTHGVGRENTENGLKITFPITPWPVTSDATHLGYLRGPQFNKTEGIDLDAIKDIFPTLVASNSYASWPAKDTYPDLHAIFYDGDKAKWPEGWFETNAKGWFVRLRSRVKFNNPGTYELVIKVPYTSVN